jgi:hypothetical protein
MPPNDKLKGNTMQRLQLTDQGLERFTAIILATGPQDEPHTHFDVDCYRQEAESIATHAFNAGKPATLIVFNPAYEDGQEVELQREWFKEAGQ